MSIDIPRDASCPPVTLGHEGAGFVMHIQPSTRCISSDGRELKEGDAVGFLYILDACFNCDGCRVHNNHCITRQMHVNGFDTDGFFAEYAVVNPESCIHLPESMDVWTASPMFCAGVTAFNCVDSCELQAGQWLCIIGCGGLGQLAIQYAKAMGANVIGLDVSDEILAIAKSLGADHVFNSRTSKTYISEIRKITSRGADTVAVFSASSAAYSSAPPLVRLGGILMVVGLPKAGVTFDALDIARGTYRIKGDSTGVPQRMAKAIDFTAKHGIRPEVEIYKALSDVSGMVEKMKSGKNTKRMVVQFR